MLRSSRPEIVVETAELRIVDLPLFTPMFISTGTMTAKRFPLLILKGEELEGIAEGIMDPAPDYLEETIAGATSFLNNLLPPSILGKRFTFPYELIRARLPAEHGALVVKVRHHHHTLLHEGQYSVERLTDGQLLFRRPDGSAIQSGVTLSEKDLPSTGWEPWSWCGVG